MYSDLLVKKPDDPELLYNFGTSAYKNNMYDDAVASFTQALKGAPLPLQEKAYFNRGNAYYRKGEEAVQANPKETEKQWQQAIDSYESALQLNSDNLQAEENRNFVRQKLEDLQRQMEQQQQQNQEEQQKQSDPKQQQDKGLEQEQQSEQERQPEEEPPGSERPQPGEEQQRQEPNNDQQDRGTEQQEQGQERADADITRSGDQQKSRPPNDASAGSMSEEEAENLLNAMEGEERDLNFIPNFSQQRSGRDW